MFAILNPRPFFVLACVLALVAVAVSPVASAQTQNDVEVRDQLIANQENLLNTYRCLFGVDTDVVPGGCPNPDTIAPGPAPANPTQKDVDVRDGLIQSQEALLNTYRCQFDVDTQLVPGGCQNGTPETGTPETGTAIAAGRGHSCGITQDGTATCWGRNNDGESDAPGGVFTAISAGGAHSCGITQDGTATCWGLNNQGMSDAPGGVFTAISAGDSHSCGITQDGTATCWGVDLWGMLDAPGGVFTAISAGDRHSCGITQDGTATCWGYNGGSFVDGRADAPQQIRFATS